MSFGIPVRNGLSIGLLASTFLTSGSGRLVPRLTLNFLTGAPLDSRITFTRSTTATFVGSDGLIQSSAINAPRFDYNPATLAPRGLLIEEQRVNLLLYSEQFDNAGWTKTNSTITANATTAPDGTVTGDKHIPNLAAILGAGATQTRVQQSPSATSGTSYTFTIYAKAGEFDQIEFALIATPSVSALFSLTSGTVVSGTDASITPAGNGWYRCTLTATAGATGALAIRWSAQSSTVSVGNGTSGIFVWGAQFEAGAFPTSYIPTVASTVTRTADSAAITGTNFSSWYNASEGTMVAFFNTTTAVVPAALGAFSVSDATANERMQIRRGNANTNASFVVVDGGSSQYNQSVTAASGPYRSALAYANGNFRGVNNGTLATAGTGTVPTVTQAEIGFAQGNTYLNGHLSSITYYATRLTNAQLQAVTS